MPARAYARFAIVALCAFVTVACRGKRNAGSDMESLELDASFVTDPATVIGTNASGIVRASLDGKRVEVVVPGSGYGLLGASRDGSTLALRGSDGGLALAHTATKKVTPIVEAGSTKPILATSRERTVFTAHGALLVLAPNDGDDALVVIDTATFAVRTVAKTGGPAPYELESVADPGHVVTRVRGRSLLVDLANGTREATTVVTEQDPGRRVSCGTKQIAPSMDDEGISMFDERDVEHVITRDASMRWHGKHARCPFRDARFTPSCGYAIFRWREQWYVAEATDRGRVGPLAVSPELFAGPF